MNITIKVIPNDQMRPGINGADWFWTPEGDLEVRVAKMSDWRYETVLAIHETVEAIMCKHNGVTQQMVDDFDMPLEASKDKDHRSTEVGDLENAPYRREHGFATAIERVLSTELDVLWNDYDNELESISGNELKS